MAGQYDYGLTLAYSLPLDAAFVWGRTMIEKIGHIKNPLTIIAIFAGIAEISGTIVLPFIRPGNQDKYVWFLMLFPALLVGIFFVTLWWRPKALYAPSDYANEENFIRMMEPATVFEVVAKAQIEAASLNLAEHEDDGAVVEDDDDAANDDITPEEIAAQIKSRAREHYKLYLESEGYALSALANEFPTLQRNVAVGQGKQRRVFDGVAESSGVLTIFEIKVAEAPSVRYIRDNAKQFASSVNGVNFEGYVRVTLIMAVVARSPSFKLNDTYPRTLKFEEARVIIRYLQP